MRELVLWAKGAKPDPPASDPSDLQMCVCSDLQMCAMAVCAAHTIDK